jgi:aldose 1-epimerase
MKTEKIEFGEKDGERQAYLFKATNSHGAYIEVIEYGATIRSIVIPDRTGNLGDVVLGKEKLDDYQAETFHSASAIGRIANRVKGPGFSVGDKKVVLDSGDGSGIILHSGPGNYATKFFEGSVKDNGDSAAITMKYTDTGEAGFGDTVDVQITYTFDEKDRLTIEYRTIPQEDTVVALTNHAYFNLGGHASESIAEHTLQIDADFYTLMIKEDVISGGVLSVNATPYDLRKEMPVGYYFSDDFDGYDTNFVLNGKGYRKISTLYDPASGRRMETYTDMPGVQVFTGGKDTNITTNGKNGVVYKPGCFVCLETQFFPDAANVAHFPSPVQYAGGEYVSRTGYYFSAV